MVSMILSRSNQVRSCRQRSYSWPDGQQTVFIPPIHWNDSASGSRSSAGDRTARKIFNRKI